MPDVHVLIAMKDVAFADQATSWIPVTLPALPAAGDTVVVRHGDGAWTATVTSRTIRESASDGPSVVIECEGRFKADS